MALFFLQPLLFTTFLFKTFALQALLLFLLFAEPSKLVSCNYASPSALDGDGGADLDFVPQTLEDGKDANPEKDL